MEDENRYDIEDNGYETVSSGGWLSNIKVVDYLVIICILSIQLFVVVSLYFYYAQGIPPSEIKTEIFAFFGVELLAMATIQVSKNRKKIKEVG